MKSKKKLFEFLNAYYAVDDFDLNQCQIANETYGRKSMIYIDCGVLRGNLLNSLLANDFNVSRSYGKDFDRLEVQVSYFKGYHCDE